MRPSGTRAGRLAEHLVGDPLVDRERVGRPVALAALGEPQPQVGPERVPRSRQSRAPCELGLVVAEEGVDEPTRVGPLQRRPRSVVLERPPCG